MSNYPCESSSETLALDWAADLTAAYSKVLGKPCPFDVTGHVHESGEQPYVEVCGCAVPWACRNDSPAAIAARVASERAGFSWPYESAWHTNAREVLAYIEWRRQDLLDPELGPWLTVFLDNPDAHTVDYLAYVDLVGGAA